VGELDSYSTADRWFVAIQVEVPDAQFYRRRTSHEVKGIDLGVKAAVTLSSGEVIEAPKPLKAALRRLEIGSRRLSRKLEAAKEMAGYGRHACLPKGTCLPVSNNRQKSAATLASSMPALPISERTLLISSRLDSAAKTKRY
jgi:putative transposase